MNARTQRICVWTGPAFIGLFLAGFLIAGFVPPPSPADDAQHIAAIFTQRTNRIRLGLIFMILGAPLLFTWCSAISTQMKRIEGRFSPLADAQLVVGGCGALLFLMPTLILEAAAYRPATRSPDITYALSDVGWLMFVGATSFALIQNLCIAVAVLGDTSARPVFPRWLGYFNLWTGLLFQPGIVIFFFTSGPFRWNGPFPWWMPLTVFGIWVAVMVVALLKAIGEQEHEAAGAGEIAGGSSGEAGAIPALQPV